MKKTYTAPWAKEIRFVTEDLMNLSNLLPEGTGDGAVSGGGDDDTTEMITPTDLF